MNAKQVAKLIASVTPEQVMQAYEGEANTCYCGCAGTYYYNPAMLEVAGKDRGYAISEGDEVSLEMITEILETVQDYFDAEDEDSYTIQEDCKGFVTHFTAVVGGTSYTVYLAPKGK